MQLSRRKRIALALSLLTAAVVCLVFALASSLHPRDVQQLENGSKIALTRFSYNNTNVFIHGKWLERMLGNFIPKAGIKLGSFQLQRPTREQFPYGDSHGLVIEFKHLTTNAASTVPLSYRPRQTVRCVIVGDDGSEYFAQGHDSRFFRRVAGLTDFMEDELQTIYREDFFNPWRSKFPDGEFEYLTASGFPRDSAWLTLRFERATNWTLPFSAPEPHWETYASFRLKNPVASKNQTWQAGVTARTVQADGFSFVLGDVTVQPGRTYESRAMDREVTIPLAVRSNGIPQPNWRVFGIRMEDASGNIREHWPAFQWRDGWWVQEDRLYLDPAKVWKIGVEFALASDSGGRSVGADPFDFRAEGLVISATGLETRFLHTLRVPLRTKVPVLTNFDGVPLRITQSGSGSSMGPSGTTNHTFYSVEILTNRPDWRILNLAAGQMPGLNSGHLYLGSPRGMVQLAVPETGSNELEFTFALVKNYHVEFFVQPKLMDHAPPLPGRTTGQFSP